MRSGRKKFWSPKVAKHPADDECRSVVSDRHVLIFVFVVTAVLVGAAFLGAILE